MQNVTALIFQYNIRAMFAETRKNFPIKLK